MNGFIFLKTDVFVEFKVGRKLEEPPINRFSSSIQKKKRSVIYGFYLFEFDFQRRYENYYLLKVINAF